MKTALLVKPYSKKPAFGIIETLIAVVILVFVLLGSVTLGSIVLRSMVTKAQKNQATNLAQVQLEQLRNIRDNLWLHPSSDCKDWDCWVEAGTSLSPVNLADTYHIIQNATTHDFHLAVGTSQEKPDFGAGSQDYVLGLKIRRANTSDVQNTDGAVVTGANNKIYLVESTVTWQSYQGDTKVVLRTYLSDWMPKY